MRQINYTKKIEERIKESSPGSVFILSDFFDIANYEAVRKIVTRLEENGTLKRIMRGIYLKPDYSDFLGEMVEPYVVDVANAIARNNGWDIVPCGHATLNAFGLSYQVPSRCVFVSNGGYKKYKYGDVVIEFKHTSSKNISNLSLKTAMVIQALKALGEQNADEKVLSRIRASLSDEEKRTMYHEAKNVTSWIYKKIRIICMGE